MAPTGPHTAMTQEVPHLSNHSSLTLTQWVLGPVPGCHRWEIPCPIITSSVTRLSAAMLHASQSHSGPRAMVILKTLQGPQNKSRTVQLSPSAVIKLAKMATNFRVCFIEYSFTTLLYFFNITWFPYNTQRSCWHIIILSLFGIWRHAENELGPVHSCQNPDTRAQAATFRDGISVFGNWEKQGRPLVSGEARGSEMMSRGAE